MKDYLDYNGKTCVVTGSASGIGKATTERLVDLGADVYALDVNEPNIPGINQFIKINLSEKESIDKAFEQLPTDIDCFFGIAGVSGQKTNFTTTIAINFVANKYITDEYLIDRMNQNGAIVYVSSAGGLRWEEPEKIKEVQSVVESKGWKQTLEALDQLKLQDNPGTLGYMFSKRALNYYIATLVPTFGKKKVRVNGILPAATETGLTDEFTSTSGNRETMLETTVGVADRIAESREMADPLIFLNSHMASFISGVLLDVDFGQNMMHVSGLKPLTYYDFNFFE